MKQLLTTFFAFALPSNLAVLALNLLGHKVHPTAKIGFSILYLQHIYLDADTYIGHFNIVIARKLLMRKGSFMKKFNRIRGPINLLFREKAALATSNSVYRGGEPVSFGIATLKLGKLGQIVSQNKLDLTKSITIGNDTTIGGHGGQFWTHGYVHEVKGSGRIRVDGEIVIGNNVYIGSRCTFNPGIYIGNSITIGSNVCVSKSLKTKGMYVSQPLRHISQDIESVKYRLKKDKNQTIEDVYEKVISY